MKDIVWGDILSVEVDVIDEDHHKQVNIFNIRNQRMATSGLPKAEKGLQLQNHGSNK